MSDEGKDYRCCPHCSEVSETDWKFDDFRGDGNCKKCGGVGKIDDSFRTQVQGFAIAVMSFGVIQDDSPTEIDCPKCEGTGQCQTCGGTGRVKRRRFEDSDELRNDEDNDTESDDEDDDYDDDNYEEDDVEEYGDNNDDIDYAEQDEYYESTKSSEIGNTKEFETGFSKDHLVENKLGREFKEKLLTALLVHYSKEESEVILQHLKDKKIEELKAEKSISLENQVTYLGSTIVIDLKFRIQILEMKIKVMTNALALGLPSINKICFRDEEVSLSALEKMFEDKVQFEVDYSILKKYELL